MPESDAGSVGSACHKITTCIGDPFVYLFVAHRQPIRIDYKVLQLLQSGRRGERADNDFVRTSDRTESFWMPTDLVKFHGHPLRFLRKKSWYVAGRCRYYIYYKKIY